MITAVTDRSQVAEARRLVSDYARRIGLPRGAHRPGRRSWSPNWPPTCSSMAAAATSMRDASRRRRTASAWKCWRWTAAGAWPMSGAAWTTATRPPAAQAPVSARSRGWPTTCGSIRGPVWAPRSWCASFAADRRHTPRDTRARCWAPRVAPYPGEQVCGDNWSFSDTVQGRLCCWPTAPATASRPRVPRKPQSRSSRPARGRVVRGNRRTRAPRPGADARRRGRRRPDRHGGAHRPLSSASATSAASLVAGERARAHGVAQRHRRARGAAHPRVHL